MSQNIQNIPKPMRSGKQPTDLLSSGNPVGCRDIKTKCFVGFVKKRKKIFIVLLLIVVSLFVSSCKTKEVPGRRRTPRHCNSCTKWSYAPQETLEYELLHNDEG
jgi:hypothetical protein